MKHRIICNWNCNLVVYEYLCAFLLLHKQVSHQFPDPKSLIHNNSSSYIFCFYYGLSYDFLLFGTPWKNSRTKAKTITWGTSHVISTTYPITIWITMESKVLNLTKPQTIVNCTLDISNNSFCYLKVNFTSTSMYLESKLTTFIISRLVAVRYIKHPIMVL